MCYTKMKADGVEKMIARHGHMEKNVIAKLCTLMPASMKWLLEEKVSGIISCLWDKKNEKLMAKAYMFKY